VGGAITEVAIVLYHQLSVGVGDQRQQSPVEVTDQQQQSPVGVANQQLPVGVAAKASNTLEM